MSLDISAALALTRIFVCVALIQQSLELFFLRKSIAQIWSPPLIALDYPLAEQIPFIRRLLVDFFSDRIFALSLILRIACAALLIVNSSPWIPVTLVFLHLLVVLRFRGNFNGGSDHMTFVVLVGLCLPAAMGLLWIAANATLSYFIAGLVKVMHRSWWNGQALQKFLDQSVYRDQGTMVRLKATPIALTLLSVLTLFFELTFPVIFALPKLTLPYLAVALLFHLGNAAVLGLNRFLFAWLSAFPALYFAANSIN